MLTQEVNMQFYDIIIIHIFLSRHMS